MDWFDLAVQGTLKSPHCMPDCVGLTESLLDLILVSTWKIFFTQKILLILFSHTRVEVERMGDS